MPGGFRITPGSAAKAAEQEKKAQGPAMTFRIPSAARAAEEAKKAQGPVAIKLQIPSAAKAAEELERESKIAPQGQFQASAGIRISSAAGQKFELPQRSATPEASTPSPAAAEAPQPPVAAAETTAAPLARLWGRFRGLFGRKV
jgi:hypothetical protein